MENNEAVLDCLKRQLGLMFKNNFYVIDLSQGDLHDNWNSIKVGDKIYDVNFSWDDEPLCSVYEVINNQTSTVGVSLSIINILGTKKEYFGDDYFEIDDELLGHSVLNQIESDIRDMDFDAYSELMMKLLKNKDNKKILFNYLSQSAQENLKEGTTTKRY